ncbi:hypothetical protein GCM10023091_13090 [Ravibacter arvi]|uniref:Uncharacterized protein n=1 Tax=Ravibacter arvi TaxID=2051041 RepID=A0ABP8LTL7_9BACT
MIHHSNENYLLDDANSPDLNRKLLGLISQDFVKVADHLKEAAYQIKKRGFSAYPLFIVSKTPTEIGTLLFGAGELENEWTYKASFLEEFVERGLIGEDSIEYFKENYRDSEEYCCVFAINNDFAGFIYIPFPED